MRILVTGVAGFIGSHVAERLLARGDQVVGIDSLNHYYDVRLKEARVARLRRAGFQFHQVDISRREALDAVVRETRPVQVIHLAAQAGVRYSVENPHAYVDSNLVGFVNILEACRHHGVQHLTYASSSSVYGANTHLPFSIADAVDHPISLSAATKKANELLAHSYSHLFRLPTTGLRFFTVYGPWGRPDMALFLFTRAILEGKLVTLYENGRMKRDFTYIDDIVEGVVRINDQPATPDPSWDSTQPVPGSSSAPYRLYNIGNDQPVEVRRLVELLETSLGRPALVESRPMPPGDVPATWANIDGLAQSVDFRPATPIEEGVPRFVEWYRGYYAV